MLDLKVASFDAQGRIQAVTWPSPDFVDGDYGLIQALFKNLMTAPGDDEFDPAWGSDIVGALMNVPGGDVPAATKAADAALAKALSDLGPDYGITRLRPQKLTFDVGSTAWLLDVLVETTDGTLSLALSA